MPDFSVPLEYLTIEVDNISEARLDVFLHQRCRWKSRTQISKTIKEGKVQVNGEVVRKPSRKVVRGDKVSLKLPPEYQQIFDYSSIELDIVYEDEYFIAINKQPDLAVQPSGKYLHKNLIYKLKDFFRKRGDSDRIFTLHRIDLETSGLILFAKNHKVAAHLTRQFEKRLIKKEYLAIVKGDIPLQKGRIEAPLFSDIENSKKVYVDEKGKTACTEFEVVESIKEYHLLKVHPLTGRQHQIRVHLAYMGTPILCDKIYSEGPFCIYDEKNLPILKRQALHSYSLRFYNPIIENYMELVAPLYKDMKNFWEALKNGKDLFFCIDDISTD